MGGTIEGGSVEIEGEGPEGEGCGEDVGVGEGALDEPDGVESGEKRDGGGDGGAGEGAGEPEDSEQGSGGDEEDEDARGEWREAGEMPPSRQEQRRQWRMGVGEGGVRDEGAGAEEIERGRDVIAGFIPEVGQAQERPVGEIERGEEEGVEQPEGKWAVRRGYLARGQHLASLRRCPAGRARCARLSCRTGPLRAERSLRDGSWLRGVRALLGTGCVATDGSTTRSRERYEVPS